MNDGIYLPFDEERFTKFRDGIDWLHDKATAAGAQIIHLTPPTFHALDARPKPGPDGKPPTSMLGGYNEVLDRYSAWLLDQRAKGWRVIDIHGPMNAFIEKQRQTNPDFIFAKDGVHPNAEGHTLIADQLIAGLVPGDAAWWQKFQTDLAANPRGAELRKLVHDYVHVLDDAWLSDIGHKRPGVNPGLPLPEAQTRAAELEEMIRALVTELQNVDFR